MATSTPFPILPKVALVGLGERISQARRVRGMTQSELAQSARVGLSTIVAIEAGSPSVNIGAIMRALDSMGLLQQVDKWLDPHLDPKFAEQAVRQLQQRARR